MKFKYKIKRILKVRADVLEEKITTYLIKNSYRITERGSGYIIFVEDEFSDRRKSRYDFHTRIGEGKFVFNCSSDSETTVELIYLTSLSYYAFLVMLVCGFGIYTNNIIMPIVFSLALTTPILCKIFYLNERVFKEIMEC
ncbi:hypothetical protein FBD94_14555 [Pedobacter hiemivivus]|uniref:Uncharacterized protein n=1 Tax=Pedobacter hiemivivus TaxID=2530454 RepID=A0A4U1G9A7_9SPHI|nr:hypothetical protein [Pedobacter hiemivivus]TKC60134.1 hypothetical protein FBD94_14555 [Pedobacter hiemivivus]